MLKKIFFGFAALIALIIMFLGWRLWPLYELAQSILPSTAAEDYAKQVDSRIIFPHP